MKCVLCARAVTLVDDTANGAAAICDECSARIGPVMNAATETALDVFDASRDAMNARYAPRVVPYMPTAVDIATAIAGAIVASIGPMRRLLAELDAKETDR